MDRSGSLARARAVVAALLVAALPASAGEWTWQNPLPQGNTLLAVWAASPSDVFAVGERGTILRRDAVAWTPMRSPTTSDLFGVWGSSAADVVAVGAGGTVVRWDGARWTVEAAGGADLLTAVWGSSASDVHAVGTGGTILHFDGAGWSPMDSGTTSDLWGVFGFSPTEVYAVGGTADPGRVLRWDGNVWAPAYVTPAAGYGLHGVWGSSPSDLWAVSSAGLVAHLLGTTWTSSASSLYGYALWGTSGSNVYAVGMDAFADPAILRFDGGGWGTVPTGLPPPAGPSAGLYGVGGSGAGDVVAVGSLGSIVQGAGASFAAVSSGTTLDVDAVWAASTTDAFAVTSDPQGVRPAAVLRFDGAAWAPVVTAPFTYGDAVWGRSPSDVWIAGGYADVMLHFDGDLWTTVSCPAGYVTGLTGTDAEVFGVGHTGVFGQPPIAFRHDGVAWSPMPVGTATRALLAVWASGGDDVFAVGQGGMILRWTSGELSRMPAPTTGDLLGVWGSSPSDVHAVGDGGRILHFDGSSWSLVPSPTPAQLRAVWGTGPADVFAAGVNGTLLRYDGDGWRAVDSGATSYLLGLGGTGPADVLAVGGRGTVLHFAAPSPSADLRLAASAAPASPKVGHDVSYVATVTNAGPDAATGVRLTDLLAPGVSLVSATPTQGTCAGAPRVACDLGTIPSGAAATVALVATPTAPGTLRATLAASGDVPDPTVADAVATPAVTVLPLEADLAVTITAASAAVSGQPLTVTVAVSNAGPDPASAVSVSIALPAGVALVSATPGQGACAGAGTVVCALGTLASGAAVPIDVVITPGAAGTVRLSAAAASPTADPVPANGAGALDLAVAAAPASPDGGGGCGCSGTGRAGGAPWLVMILAAALAMRRRP